MREDEELPKTSEDDIGSPAPAGSRDPETGDVVPTAQAFSGRGARALGSRYDYDDGMPLESDRCGWKGPASAGDKDFFDELFDISCPVCDAMRLIVPYPTDEETKKAAVAGNEEAQEHLETVQGRERRWARSEDVELKPDSEVPELSGERLDFVWDIDNADRRERPDDDAWTVISCGDVTVWRELAYWEGYERFNDVRAILKARYGPRFARLKPTEASIGYLYGDAWGSARIEET